MFKFNIPNKITIIRVSLIPLFAIILLANIPYKNVLAAFIFGLLSISDFLDGYFARKKKQITEFGKLIDPIADKLLISTALIFLIGKGVELWMAVAIIAREVIITGIRIYLLPSKIVVPASNFGKAKTVVQSIAIVFVLLKLPLSLYFMFAAVLITIISGLEYLIRIREMTGNKIVNLPNLITLFRFLLITPFVYYFLNSKIQLSLLIFAIITLSDKLDGISARLINQKTELGSWFDSFTDYTLIISTLIILFSKNYLNIFWIISFLIASTLIWLMKLIYYRRLKKVPVSFIARLNVTLVYITLLIIIINFNFKIKTFEIGMYYIMTLTLITVYITMLVYMYKVINILRKNLNKV